MIYWIIGIAIVVVAFIAACYFVPGYCVYTATLTRNKKDKWGREPQFDNDVYVKMDGRGIEWHESHKQYKKDVHIVRDGINLYGEYYDLGYDRCAMILSGRTESLRYGYFFAKPYEELGFNILVVDPRAHGLSDGLCNTVGFEESKDDIAWVKYIHDTFGVKSFIFHGICIGSAGGLLAITSDQCPDYVEGLVAEGMFINFNESVKNHVLERNKPLYPTLMMVDWWMKRYTGHSMKYGPIDVMDKMNKPLLMIHSKEDAYSTPDNAQKLYDMCPSDKKMIHWYEHGAHSMLRPMDSEQYDNAIKEFVNKFFDK